MQENPYKSPVDHRRRRRRNAEELLLDAVAIAAGVLVIGMLVAAAVRLAFLAV